MSRCAHALWRLLGFEALIRTEIERYMARSDQRERDNPGYWVDTQYVDEAVRREVYENAQLFISELARQPGC